MADDLRIVTSVYMERLLSMIVALPGSSDYWERCTKRSVPFIRIYIIIYNYIYNVYHIWLVIWIMALFFDSVGHVIIPTVTQSIVFQRGRSTINQKMWGMARHGSEFWKDQVLTTRTLDDRTTMFPIQHTLW